RQARGVVLRNGVGSHDVGILTVNVDRIEACSYRGPDLERWRRRVGDEEPADIPAVYHVGVLILYSYGQWAAEEGGGKGCTPDHHTLRPADGDDIHGAVRLVNHVGITVLGREVNGPA